METARSVAGSVTWLSFIFDAKASPISPPIKREGKPLGLERCPAPTTDPCFPDLRRRISARKMVEPKGYGKLSAHPTSEWKASPHCPQFTGEHPRRGAPKGDGFLTQIRRRRPAVPASTILEDHRVFRRCGRPRSQARPSVTLFLPIPGAFRLTYQICLVLFGFTQLAM
jgi:hypothetical protein